MKPNQGKIYLDPKRFGIVVAGRRFAKTTTLLYKLFSWAYNAPEYDGGIWGYFAPTYKQAKLIAWDILKRIAEPKYLLNGRANESDLQVILKNGQPIRLFGVDKPESLFGIKLLGGVGDEFDHWKPKVYDTYLRPALSDTGGKFWFAGNPDSTKRRLKALYDKIGLTVKENPNAPYARYKFKSIDGGYIPAEEIEQAKRDLDERTYLEQYEAAFLDLLGQVYYGFSDANVCDIDPHGLPVSYNPRLPIRIHWDFNVNPFCVGVSHFIQRNGRDGLGHPYVYQDVHVIDEFVIRNSNTTEMACVIREKYAQHKAGIICYGDAAGKARHTSSSMSDWQLIHNIFKDMQGFSLRVKEANPFVKDRINAVNSKLCNYQKERHVFIKPKCKRLVTDFMNVTFKDGSTDLDKSDLDLTHISDGFGYMVDYEFPVIKTFVRS